MSGGLPDAFAPEERRFALYEGVRYEEYWRGRGRVLQDALERYLIERLLPESGRRIIDVGGGYGRLTPCYVERFDEAVLYDGSMSLLRRARETYGDAVTLVAGDATRMPFAHGTFDCTLTIRLLQHMPDLTPAFAELRRVTSGGGELVYSYHNKRNVRRMARRMMSRSMADPFTLDSAEVSATLISHHPDRVDAVIEQAGFGTPEYLGAMVLNPLARASTHGRVPSGASTAGFTGRHRLAPWLIGTTRAIGDEPIDERASLRDLLRCPACFSAVGPSADGHECITCGAFYPTRDGILDFRVREARDGSHSG